jgi:glycosyltransferase involved in cell wall biosynthesis
MPDSSAIAASPRRPLSICIVACKDLSLNMRTVRQARSLARAGHHVTVVAYKPPDRRLAGDDTAVEFLRTGVPPFPKLLMVRLWVLGQVFGNRDRQHRDAVVGVDAGYSRACRFSCRVLGRLAGRPFDVVQAHFDRALIAASRLAAVCGAKLVFDAVEVPFDPEMLPSGPAERAIRVAEIERETEIARSVDAWVTVNETIADNIVDRFAAPRPVVLRNYQDQGDSHSDGRLRRDLGLGEDARILLHLNTMRVGEGLETIIDALPLLPPQFHLVGLGPVPLRSYLQEIKQKALRLGVAERFHIAPMQQPHAVCAYIAGADLGIIAREGDRQNMRFSLPNRLFQMIAARLPVAVTPLSEIARIVREYRFGEIFEERDSAGLAAAIIRITEPAAWPAYRQGVDNAATALNWETESTRYVQLIEDLAVDARTGIVPTHRMIEGVAGN